MSIPILGTLLTGVVDYFSHKQELKSIKRKAEIDEAKQGNLHEAKIDEISIGTRGWLDDFLTVVTMSPILVIFTEPLLIAWNDYENGAMTIAVQEAFRVLETTPSYYWIGLAVVYINAFGLRRMLRGVIEGYLKKRL